MSEEKEPRQFNGSLPQWFLAYFVSSVVSVRTACVPESAALGKGRGATGSQLC